MNDQAGILAHEHMGASHPWEVRTRPDHPAWVPGKSTRRRVLQAAALSLLMSTAALAQSPGAPAKPYEPRLGQSGKDVMWLPSKEAMVERLFQMAEVTRRDLVVDLGSGDGKIPIAAARTRGARGLGIEFNPNMVEFSKRRASEQGVADKVEFRQGDIFQSDYSQATVVTLYLLPELNVRLRPDLLKMKPGTRIVSNSWDMQSWLPDETTAIDTTEGYLWIIPAHVAGDWTLTLRDRGAQTPVTLRLKQRFQMVDGDADFGKFRARLQDTKLRGDVLRFAYRDAHGTPVALQGKIDGNTLAGTALVGRKRVAFTATRSVVPAPFPEGAPTQEEITAAIRVLGNQ